MKPLRAIASAAATGLLGAGLLVAAPGSAAAADPCRLGWSSTGPRECVSESFHMAPVFTLGDGICGGMISAGGTAFDGPLDETYHVYGAAGAVHSVELQILQGFPVLGEWGPILLRCDVTAVMDWHNLDTGERGTETRFVPASNRSFTREYVYMNTGPGRVHITMRTDHPSIPVTMDVVVP